MFTGMRRLFLLFFSLIIFSCGSREEEAKQAVSAIEVAPITVDHKVTLGNQLSSTHGYYDAERNKSFGEDSCDGQIKFIDFVFFHDTSSTPFFAAPSDTMLHTVRKNVSAWPSQNKTYFKFTGLTEDDFDRLAYDREVLQRAWVASDTPLYTKIPAKPGTVFAYQIDETGKYGLVKVVNVSGDAKSPGQVNFYIKRQN